MSEIRDSDRAVANMVLWVFAVDDNPTIHDMAALIAEAMQPEREAAAKLVEVSISALCFIEALVSEADEADVECEDELAEVHQLDTAIKAYKETI